MSVLKKIQNKPTSTRYLILVVSVIFSMSLIVYLWAIFLDSSFISVMQGQITQNEDNRNGPLKLASLKESLKSSVNDFANIFSNITSDVNSSIGEKENKNGDLQNSDSAKLLKFPDSY